MISALAACVVLLAGSFLIGLGGACLLRPSLARRFLMSFACTSTIHLIELAGRMVVGAALFVHAPFSAYPLALSGAGIVLMGTTALLLLVPWRWHRLFALKTVPPALKFPAAMGGVSIALGLALLSAC